MTSCKQTDWYGMVWSIRKTGEQFVENNNEVILIFNNILLCQEFIEKYVPDATMLENLE